MATVAALREQPEPGTSAEEAEAPECPVCGDELLSAEADPTYQRRRAVCKCGVTVSWSAEVGELECEQEIADTEAVPGALVLPLPLPDDLADARRAWERKLKRERQRRWRQGRKVKVIASLM